jgi:hypothetical protein
MNNKKNTVKSCQIFCAAPGFGLAPEHFHAGLGFFYAGLGFFHAEPREK